MQQRSEATKLAEDSKSVYLNDTMNDKEKPKMTEETTTEKETQETDPWKEADSQKSDMTAATVTPKR